MSILDLQHLTNLILGCSFLIAYTLGFILQRTQFCTMGAIADVFLMENWSRAWQWTIATGTTMLGFGILSMMGQIDPTQNLYFATKWYWASTLVGGLLFGVGMVLSSGCGLKSIVRAGAGNLKSLVVLIVMGTFAFMTIKGFFAVLRVATLDRLFINVSGGAIWPNLLGFSTADQWGLCAVVVATLVLFFLLFLKNARQASTWLTGISVGLLFVAVWWVSGHLGFVPEHPQTLEAVYVGSKSGRMEALSFVGPVAYFWNWLEFYSDQSNVLSTGVVAVIGVFFGSLSSAVTSSTFKWEGFTQSEDLGFHLIGAAIMGVGGVLALGCSVGQGISGISTLSINATSALIGIILGAWICLSYRANLVDCSTP